VRKRNSLLTALIGVALLVVPAVTARASADVARATLSNGLRVIVVRDPLAPVATAMLN
jgi:zinc protease